MIAVGDIVWGGFVPALVAAATMAVVWRTARGAKLGWLLGVTLGLLAGFCGLDAQGAGLTTALAKMFRPLEARDWLPALVLSAAAIELASLWGRMATWMTWVLRVLWCLFVPWRLLAGSVYLPAADPNPAFHNNAWSTAEAAAWLGGASALLAFTWLLMWLMPAGIQPRLRSSLTSLAALGATATVTLSGSQIVGQLLGVLTAALVGCGIVAAALRLDRGPESAAGPLIAAFGGVLVIAKFLLSPELPLFTTLMLLLALVAAVAWIDPPRWLSKCSHAVVRIAVCLAALAMTVIPAAREFIAAQAERAADPYYNLEQ